MKTNEYRLKGSTEYPEGVTDFVHRRVRPFLDRFGTQTRSLEHLMAEAYLQGTKDAVNVMREAHE